MTCVTYEQPTFSLINDLAGTVAAALGRGARAAGTAGIRTRSGRWLDRGR